MGREGEKQENNLIQIIVVAGICICPLFIKIKYPCSWRIFFLYVFRKVTVFSNTHWHNRTHVKLITLELLIYFYFEFIWNLMAIWRWLYLTIYSITLLVWVFNISWKNSLLVFVFNSFQNVFERFLHSYESSLVRWKFISIYATQVLFIYHWKKIQRLAYDTDLLFPQRLGQT